jgi:hypothetical protein
MTQTLDVLDVNERIAQRDNSRAKGAPTCATQTAANKFGTFAITFGIAFAILYTVFERLNWPLFTYHPVSGKLDFWRQPAGVGPPMFWYGWIVLAAASALVVGWIATIVSDQWLRRATVFCCALAALWPAALAGLRIYITDWATFDADFLNSIWLAGIPAVVAAAAISYLVSSQWVQRTWTGWLLIMPIGGLVVLGYSLLPYFTRVR